MCIDARLKHIILLVVLAHSIFYSGCSVPHIVRQANGDFVSGLEGWEVAPVESVAVVGEEKILDVELSSEKQVSILKKWPLSPKTEIVRVSFRVRYDPGREWDGHLNPVFMLNLQEPVGYGNYRTGGLAVNPHGNWETEEVVHIYTGGHANPRFTQHRPLPTELVLEIVLRPGYGKFQFDDFRVEELVTATIIQHE
jgi:hypothetical protein